MIRRSLVSWAGFTLLELLIVVAIVGILAAIAYPTYLDQVTSARRADGKALLMSAVSRQEQFFLDNKIYGTMAQLSFTNPDGSPAYCSAMEICSEENYYSVSVLRTAINVCW